MTLHATPIPLPILGPWLAQDLSASLPDSFLPLVLHSAPDFMAQLAPYVPRIRALVCTSGGQPIDATLMEQLPQLELILNLGAGTECVDLAAAQARGIQVLTGAGVNAVDVAELAIGMMISMARRIHFADREVRALQWGADRKPVRRLAGQRVGIAGMGAIGQAIAKRLLAFDMPISYFSRRPVEALPYTHHADLQSLATAVDFLFLALPGGSATLHLVNADILSALGPQGYVINVGRGSVVDEQALAQALAAGQIAGASLDVFEHEPQVPDSLVQSPNTLLQPHRGGFTVEAHEEIIALTLQRLAGLYAKSSSLIR
jgi:lactate dehydrogenase-like 2-hydroxyacid dehydrogenase